MTYLVDHLAILMFVTLAGLIFVGFPVAFVLAGTGLAFGLLGWIFDVFNPLQFFNILPRIWGGIAHNQVLVAVPMFIVMGTVLERSGVAKQLLICLQILLRRTPAGLALAVTLMGTIMAATTGIVGASVVMLALIALPTMVERGYDKRLAAGTIAASGTLGILIPPSIMLIVIADQIQVPVGTLFMGAMVPGLMLSALYTVFILMVGALAPHRAPPLASDAGPQTAVELIVLVVKSLIAPSVLILLVLGSIFLGWATPTEASGIGVIGALAIAWMNRSLSREALWEAIDSAALTNAMVFFVIMGATVFSYVFRALGGDDLVIDLLAAAGIRDGWSILIFLMVLVFLMGFFFDWIEIILIVLPIFAPVLQQVDFSQHGIATTHAFLTWFAISLSVILQTSFLTPPFAISLFFLKGAMPGVLTVKDTYIGVIPFVAIQLVAVALVVALPELALWLPRILGYFD
ncbi:MAG: TRAP transporter large permease subunit [Hyphomicrobiaceae bacterium]|nr:TRAP transporter large permease subunit [Hyphomicrobiaceae bacterium]